MSTAFKAALAAADQRETAFTRATDLLPADASPDLVMRTAEWLLTGATAVDSARVEAAAKSLAASDSRSWDVMTAGARDQYRGAALRAITAYLQH